MPYLEDEWYERGINAINEKCKVGRWVVVGDGMKVEISLLKQGQIWRLPYLVDEWYERGINAINEKCKVGRNGWRGGGGKLRKP